MLLLSKSCIKAVLISVLYLFQILFGIQANTPPLRFNGLDDIYRQPQLYEIGRQVPVSCRAEAHPTATYSWFKEGQILASNISYTYRLRNITLSDAGQYYCVASNTFGSLRSKTLTVQVGYFRFLAKPRPRIFQSSKAGSFAIISLPDIDSVPDFTATWRKNDGTILSNARTHITFDNKVILLDLKENQNNDVFHANVGNGYEKSEAKAPKIILNVERQAHIPSVLYPENVIPPRNQTVIENKPRVVFECVFNARPLSDLEINWYHVANSLRPRRKLRNGSNHIFSHFNRRLTILDVKQKHSGIYQCEALLKYHTKHAPIQLEAHLNVHVPPKLSGSENEILVAEFGQSKVMHCKSRAVYPSPAITWYWNAIQIWSHGANNLRSPDWKMSPNGETLNIKNIRTTDSGVFQCFLNNSAGEDFKSFWINVSSFPPRIVNILSNVTSTEKQRTQLDCYVEGLPKPTIQWFRENGQLVQKSPGRIHLDGNNGSLIFLSTRTSDEGLYTCKAFNVLGSHNSSLQFWVFNSTEIIKPYPTRRTHRALTASSLRLRCLVQYDVRVGMNITWMKQHRPRFSSESPYYQSVNLLPESHRFLIHKDTTRNPTESILEILHVEEKDAGLYQCRVHSTAGSDTLTLTVRIVKPPEPPELEHVSEFKESGSTCFEMTWSNVAGNVEESEAESQLLGYLIYAKCETLNENWSVKAYVNANEHYHKICDFYPGYKYQLTIASRTAVATSRKSPYKKKIQVPISKPLYSPTRIFGYTSSATSVTIEWAPPNSLGKPTLVTGYEIHLNPINANLSKPKKWRLKSSTVFQYLIPELEPYQSYKVSVAAYNSEGVGPSSDPILIRTEMVPPPQNLLSFMEEEGINSSTVTFKLKFSSQMSVLSNQEIYYVSRLDCAANLPDNPCKSIEITRLCTPQMIQSRVFAIQMDGLIAGMRYHLTVSLKNAAGESKQKVSQSIRATEDLPGPVQQLRIVSVDESQISLQWKAPLRFTGQLSAYQINFTEIGISTQPKIKSHFLSAETHRYVLSNLRPMTEYRINITAYNARGYGPQSSLRIRTDKQDMSRPDTPTSLSASDVTSDSAQLSFHPGVRNQHASLDWLVEYQTAHPNYTNLTDQPIYPWTPFHHWSDANSQSKQGYRTFHLRKLSPYRSYRFRVLAVNKFASSHASSASIWIQTKPSTALVAPSNVEIRILNATSFRVFWKPLLNEAWNAEPIGYMIEYELQSVSGLYERTQKLEVQSTQYSVVISGLTPDSNYVITVCSVNSEGRGPRSSPKQVRTWDSAPHAAPEDVTVSGISSSGVEIKWTYPADHKTVLGYKVYYWSQYEGKSFSREVTTPNDSPQCSLSGLYFSTYYVQVAAFNSIGVGPRGPSEPAVFTTKESKPGPPTGIHFLMNRSDITSPVLVWSPPYPPRADVIGYSVRYYTKDVPESSVEEQGALSASTLQYPLRNLKREAMYQFKIKSRTSTDYSETVLVNYHVSYTPESPATPTKPIILLPPKESTGQVLLLWFLKWRSSSISIRNYTLQVRRVGTPSRLPSHWTDHEQVPYSGHQTFHLVRNLQADTEYEFRVASNGDWARGSFSETSSTFSVSSCPPKSAPSDISVRYLNQSYLEVIWKAIPNENWCGKSLGYWIHASSSNWQPAYYMHRVSGKHRSKIIPIKPGFFQVAWIKVAAFNSHFSGPFSPAVRVELKRVTLPPEILAETFKCSASSPREIFCDWSSAINVKNNPAVLGFKISCSPSSNFRTRHYHRSVYPNSARISSTRHLLVPKESLTATISGLSIFKTYSIYITSFNEAGESKWSGPGKIIQTQQGKPSVVKDVQLYETTMTSVKIKWLEPEHLNGLIDKYKIEYTKINKVIWTSLVLPAKQLLNTHVDLLTYRLTQLQRNSVYDIRIRARNRAGWGAASPAVRLNTQPVPGSPKQPTLITPPSHATQPGGRQFDATLRWKLNSDARDGNSEESAVIAVIIEARERNSAEWMEVDYIRHAIETYKINYDKLKSDSSYQFRVISSNRKGLSRPSGSSRWIHTPAAAEIALDQWWFIVVVTLCLSVILILTISMVIVLVRKRRSKAKKKSISAYVRQSKSESASFLTANPTAFFDASNNDMVLPTIKGPMCRPPSPFYNMAVSSESTVMTEMPFYGTLSKRASQRLSSSPPITSTYIPSQRYSPPVHECSHSMSTLQTQKKQKRVSLDLASADRPVNAPFSPPLEYSDSSDSERTTLNHIPPTSFMPTSRAILLRQSKPVEDGSLSCGSMSQRQYYNTISHRLVCSTGIPVVENSVPVTSNPCAEILHATPSSLTEDGPASSTFLLPKMQPNYFSMLGNSPQKVGPNGFLFDHSLLQYHLPDSNSHFTSSLV